MFSRNRFTPLHNFHTGESGYARPPTSYSREMQLALDAEFAKRLQCNLDFGIEIDQHVDAKSLLGSRVPNETLGERRHNDHRTEWRDKAKTRAFDDNNVRASSNFSGSPQAMNSTLTCGICFEPFQMARSPIKASKYGDPSCAIPYGIRLPCPKWHGYCLDCIANYIKSKLDPQGNGQGKANGGVFPIGCPECTRADWVDGIQDGTARKILDKKCMDLWYHQKLLDATPRLYCPNSRCSALIEAHPNEHLAHATCPACHQAICVSCRVVWHQNLTCAEFQALPPDERSPDDLSFLKLVIAKNWRRCPGCHAVVERTQGCNHIACTCGAHFCFKCGSHATPTGTCLKNPPCNSLEVGQMVEDMERVRRRAEIPPPVINQPAFPSRGIVVPPRLHPALAPPSALDRSYLPTFNLNTRPTLPHLDANWQQWQPPAFWPNNYAQPWTYGAYYPQPTYLWSPFQTSYQYQARAPYYASYAPYASNFR